jgi:hypothetical protein
VEWPWVSTSGCLLAAAAIALHTDSSLPQAFRMMPTQAQAAVPEDASSAKLDRPVGRLEILRTLFHLLHTAPPWKQFTPWMVYTFVALMGFVIGGGVERWKEYSDLRLLYLPFGSYMLFAGIGVITYNLFRIDAIPVSRRTVLLVLTMPGLFFYCLGYGTGSWTRSSATARSPLVDFHVVQASLQSYRHNGPDAEPTNHRSTVSMVWVEVDPAFMGLCLTGDAPTITGPNGESHEAWSETLFRGGKPIAFNPYNTSEETTAEFEAAMLSRAIEDVYGQTIAADELRERYFVVEDGRVVDLQRIRQVEQDRWPDTSVMAATGGFSLLEDYPQLTAPGRGPDTPIYMLFVLVPWFLLTALFFRSLRATHGLKFVRRVYWAGLAIPMLAMLGQVLLAVFGLFSPEAARAYLAVTIRALGSSPALWVATWVVSLILIGATYWLALRQLERAELPTSPINCSLVDWGKVD